MRGRKKSRRNETTDGRAIELKGIGQVEDWLAGVLGQRHSTGKLETQNVVRSNHETLRV